MEKLVAQMYLNADFAAVKNAVNHFIRDGVLTTHKEYCELYDIADEATLDHGDVFHLSMSEQPKLGNETRAVWCIGQSAVMAEDAGISSEGGLTTLRLLAVKGIIHADRAAFDDWVTLQLGFQAMGLAVRETSAWSLPLEWQLGAIERDMANGKKPHIPDKAEFTRRLVEDPLGDSEESGGWFFCQVFGGAEPPGSLDNMVSSVKRIWERYLRASCQVVEDIQSMYAEHPEFIDQEWDDFSEITERWPGQYAEIQRLKDCSVEEATARYFAELGAGESVQSQMPAAPKRQGGRPRLAVNEWAYEQVWVKGRERQEVFREWRERIGSKKALLADPRDSFNKAVREKSRKKRK